ncbi:MAG: SDR family oxidoreductase [Clostridiales bacterium]|jgi:short-subunit dehydrogenase|nr:SDR family oxidoreductase [Clostridiales bacterium]
MKKTIREKKVVLVTGASSGIGKSCADYLAKKDCRVYGTSRFPERTTSGSLSEQYTLIQMDVNDDSSVKKGINRILQKEGRIDIVVNNAGYALAGAIEDTTIDETKAQFETNFFGVLRICREVLPVMRSQKSGYIISISSIGGLIGIPFQGMYSASKFAMEGFMEVLNMEVKCYGIHAVLIEPGDFRTNLTANRVRTSLAKESNVYKKCFEQAIGVMENDESNGPGPEKIARLLERIINNPHPQLRYPVGNISQKLAIRLKKFLPYKLFELLMKKYYKLI